MSTNERILQLMLEKHPKQSIIQIERMNVAFIRDLISSLPMSLSLLILEKMNVGKISPLLELMDVEQSAPLIEQLPPSSSLSLLRMVDVELRDRILDKMNDGLSSQLSKMLSYPDNTVGAVVDPFVVTLTDDLTVQQALDTIGESKLKLYPNTLVLNRERTIKGFVDIRQLLASDNNAPIAPLTKESPDEILADMDRETQLKNWDFNLPAVTVVDLDGLFLGVVSKDNLAKSKSRTTSNMAGKTASMALGDLYRVGLSGLFYGTEEVNEQKN